MKLFSHRLLLFEKEKKPIIIMVSVHLIVQKQYMVPELFKMLIIDQKQQSLRKAVF